MLRFESLELNDFGPFKGQQRIEFPPEPGVVLVYGENMRGKTSLLNAFRYALFGRVIGRGSRDVPLASVVNWEASAEGRHGFSVTLRFSERSTKYALTRALVPDSPDPEGASDYTAETILERDGTILGPDEASAVITKLIPEQISRFFLFDGELLQEYEELLSSSDMGRKIAEAIERILGLPALSNGRTDLESLIQLAEREASQEAKKHTETKQHGELLETLMQHRDSLTADEEKLNDRLRDLRDRKTEAERYLSRYERIGGLINERDRLQEDVDRLEARLDEKRERLRAQMSASWKGILREAVLDARAAIRVRIQDTTDRLKQVQLRNLKVAEKLKAVEDGACPTCGQTVTDLYVGEDPEQDLERELRGEVEDLQQELAYVGELDGAPDVVAIADLWDECDELSVEIADKRGRIRDLRSAIDDVDPEEFREQKKEYDRVVAKISEAESALKQTRALLAEGKGKIEKAQAQIRKLSGGNVDAANRKLDLLRRLAALFTEAIGVYRDELRARVEADASDLFQQLTSDPDYAGLRINEQYGLTIRHKDGEDIPVRSAGAEHVVALALMGALQRNAPLRGPIIMDSPFGRLDAEHTRNVVASLPGMSDQVALLVYTSELTPDLAREELRGKLRAEFRMVRRTARHTDIEAVTGDVADG